VNTTFPKVLGFFTGWLSNGPWRSKSFWAALAVFVVGMGFWVSDIKKGPPPNQTGTASTDVSTATPSNPSPAAAVTDWNWRKSFPWYVNISGSYVLGFCIGWFFRKLLQLAVVVAALAIALLAFGKYVGWDTSHMQQQVKRGGEWAQHEATAGEDYLKRLLPSATGGAVGTFLGFRRRGKAVSPEPDKPAQSAG
jgi:uncharacterized membrane protein (Fun14 family)